MAGRCLGTRGSVTRRREGAVYIGIGTIVAILLLIVLIAFVF